MNPNLEHQLISTQRNDVVDEFEQFFILGCGVCRWAGTIKLNHEDFNGKTENWKNAKQEYDEHIKNENK